MAGRHLSPFMILAKPIGPVCNLRCEYCFYLSKEKMFGHGSQSGYVMSDEVLEEFVRQYIEAQPEGTEELNFAWQGGEPLLLPQRFFEKVLKLQQKYKRAGMSVNNAIQTNGTLISRERARWFAEKGFLVGVSIDGDEALHNRYRKDREGKGSFSKVMEGIENLESAGAEFNTLTVVQDDNAEYPERVYDFLTGIGSRYLQFIPIVEPLEGGRVSKRTVNPAQWGKFMNRIFDRWAISDIGAVFIQHFDVLLGVYAGYPASLCVHSRVCGHALAVEHDGTLYSCDHFVTEKNRLGSILEHDISILVSGDKQRTFGESKSSLLPKECLDCAWLQLCYGGCPKDRIVNLQDGKINYLCRGYKEFYSHAAPYLRAMAQCLGRKTSPANFRNFIDFSGQNPGRNAPCPCLSGKKYKNCHGK